MDQYLDVHQWLSLAEKLILYNHISGCFDICNEAEAFIGRMDVSTKSNKHLMEDSLQRLKRLKLKLNGIMASEVRRSFKDRIKKTRAAIHASR
jgi:hypothetical protein